MRDSFTLVEIILVVIISAILFLGSFKAIEMLYLHSVKARAITELSMRSQIALEQIAGLLYQRIPDTVINYDPSDDTCQAIEDSNESRPILEWLVYAEQNLTDGKYDSFVDMADSNSSTKTLDTNVSISEDEILKMNLIFAGDKSIKACKGAYGWHGNDSNLSFDINISEDNSESGDIVVIDEKSPDFIYEKYYLATKAYALARSQDIDLNAKCIDDNLTSNGWIKNNNTLLLFYNYHPWKGETFCADPNSDATQAGSVVILAEYISGFRVDYINSALRISLDMNKSIRGSKNSIHLSKQRGVF